MRESDIRLLMEISPDREIRPGWQRGVEIQRTRTIKAGKLLYCSSYPIWDTATRREAEAQLAKARERKGTSEAQKKLNARKAEEKLVQIINANFGAGDLLPTLTYSPRKRPKDLKEAQKDVKNFIARLRRLCAKRGVPDPKYVYVTETLEKTRGKDYHHHMVLAVQLDRDEVEALWRQKHGHGNIRIGWDEREGLTGYARYIAKQVCASGNAEEFRSRHRWAASKGLKIPQPTEADKKISRRRVEKIAQEIKRDPDLAKLHMEVCYPGYEVLEMQVRTSEWVTGAYVYAVMCRRE